MKNFVQPGTTLTLSAPYDVASGAGFVVGALFAIASCDAVAGTEVEGVTCGVFTLPKTGAQPWAIGARVYWDDVNKRCDSDAAKGRLIGVATVVAANPSTVGYVRLNGGAVGAGGGSAATVPGQPVKPVLTAMVGAVSLAWTPGAAGSTATTGNAWTDINGTVTQLTTNPQVISGLTPGAPYTGTVTTRNAQGAGPASAQADEVTPSAAPVGNGLPVVPAGTPISTYTTAARSLPAGMTDNTADPFPGTASSVTASFSSATNPPKDIRPLDLSGNVVDIRNGLVSFAVKLRPSGSLARGLLNMGACYCNLYNDTTPGSTKANYIRANFGNLTFNGETFTGDWQVFRIPIEAFVAVGNVPDVQAYLQSVTYGGLQFVHNVNNADTFQVSVARDSFAKVPKAINKALVIIGFDDCLVSAYSHAFQIMKQYNIPGTLYPGDVITRLGMNNATFLSKAQVAEMMAAGWQMASQAGRTENPQMTTAEFDAAMAELAAYNAENGFTEAFDGSYFSNVNFNNPLYQSVFDKYFRTMRGFNQYDKAAIPRPETIPPSDPRRWRSYGVNTATNSATESLIPFLQRAIDWTSCAELTFHDVSAGDFKHSVDGGVLTSLEKTCQFIDANRQFLEPVTKAEAIRRWGAGTP